MNMDFDINWDQIDRAADGMISNYGNDALAEAEKRAKAMRLQGRHTAAVTWDSICEHIKVRACSSHS